MSALGTLAKVASDPDVRAIVLPLAKQVVDWVRGGRRPRWLDGALSEVPELGSPIAMAEIRNRMAKR